jgi:hypothetical protein
MNSFLININSVYSFDGVKLRTWGTVGNRHWALILPDATSSTYLIEGFKNINLYSVEMVGMCQTNVANVSGTSCTVNDYGIFLTLDGLLPAVSGVNAPLNNYAINSNFNKMSLTKFTNKLNFETPIQSLKSVKFNNLFAHGQNAESSTEINLQVNLTFIFNYKYEGED